MTYLRFHTLFNAPVLLGLFIWNCCYPWLREELFVIAAILVVVMIFTSPWDNYAVKKGIWGFPEGKYWFKIRYLPFEEYLFFVIETVNVILLVRGLIHSLPAWRANTETVLGLGEWVGSGALLVLWFVIGFILFRKKTALSWNYTIHLLFWFLPVIFLQWTIGWSVFLAGWRLWLLPTLVFGVYYTITDLVAVHNETWTFDEKQITGHKLASVLPWEEIAFFFLTALLVAQSYLLLLPAQWR